MDKDSIQKFFLLLLVSMSIIIALENYPFTSETFTPEYMYGWLNSRVKNVPPRSTTPTMTYGKFLEYLEIGWVKQVDLYDNNRSAIVQAASPELGARPQSVRVEIPIGASQLIQKLKENNIDFDSHPAPKKNIFITILNNLLIPILFIIALLFFFDNSDEFDFPDDSVNSLMNIGNSTAKFYLRVDTGVTFDDIAGIDEAKAEFEEIVSFLKEPERYTRVGARIPKGALLVGPPGTGKTLLARAIATEAKVPFFSVAGSEFVEMFIGIGASRIRDLFTQAAENAPCIVFIDEIDAVGRERGSGVGGGNDEREQTLNQLLTEMDGFKENRGVIVVGATNRADILDAALLRPGRFDRQISVGLPDRLGRISILKVHARNKPLDKDVSLPKLAGKTPGFSGADLANLLNESAILATRYNRSKINMSLIEEAVDRIIGGIAGTKLEETKNKRLIAYHEIGHALAGTVLEYHDPVEKITLVPRGSAKGLTWFISDEDQTLVTRLQLLSRIVMIISGRVTEELVFGNTEVTTGASNDLQQLTNIARQMVTRYGMSSIGPIALDDDENGSGYTNDMANRIDHEIYRIIDYCEIISNQIILDNRVAMDLAVEKLLGIETLDGDEFRAIISKYTKIPEKEILR